MRVLGSGSVSGRCVVKCTNYANVSPYVLVKSFGKSGNRVKCQDSAIVVPDAVSIREPLGSLAAWPFARCPRGVGMHPVPGASRGSPAARDKCFWKSGNRVKCQGVVEIGVEIGCGIGAEVLKFGMVLVKCGAMSGLDPVSRKVCFSEIT